MSTQIQRPAKFEPITSGTRSNAVDIVKGIAIILVVYGHTAQGMMHRGWWSTPGAFFSEAFIYSFHMPAFFFIAGLFVIGSIERRGARRFTAEKLKTVLYPYLLFVIIAAAIDPLVGRFKSSVTQFHWKPFLLSLADGEASWFLFALFICLMLALVTVRVPAWVRFVGAALGGMLIPLSGPPLTNQSLREFCFLAAGMWVGARIYRLERMHTSAVVVWLLVLAAIQFAAIYFYGSPVAWTYLALGLTGTALLFCSAKLLDKHKIGDGLAWVGRGSLAVFLISPFLQGATREILSRVFHTHELWLQLLLPTAFATLLPTIIWHQQDRWRVSWLFHWPLS
jgi:fucose 4-O-acetylase-like acetyltransferase